MHFLTFAAFHGVYNKYNKRACIECDGTKLKANYFSTSSSSGCKEYFTVGHLLQIRYPDGHSGLLTFGVLIFGVGGSGFRMFGVSDVGGSVFFSDIRGFWCF